MSEQPISLTWYVLYVASRCEHAVAKQLTRDGIEHCVPVQKQWHQWSDRKKLVEVVLFPGYVFVGLYHGEQHADVLKMKHVGGFVKFGAEKAVLSKRDLALIRQLGQAEHPVQVSAGALAQGDEVEITAGPLKQFRGRIIAMNGSARVQVAIPSLGMLAQVVVARGHVKKLAYL